MEAVNHLAFKEYLARFDMATAEMTGEHENIP
jgi:hypothetical protein